MEQYKIGCDYLKIIAIIQARMGSTRLPEKILKPLGHLDVLTYVTCRCKQIVGVDQVIVATSTLPQDDVIEEWCDEHNVTCFRGSEDDVLSRYVECAKQYEPDYVMRVTSDCPFVDYEMASEIVTLLGNNPKDIVLLEGKLPRGLAVELISYASLLKIDEAGHESRHREHVTYYAYEFADQFKGITYKVPDNRQAPEFRITLDTDDDYALIQAVAEHFNDPLISSVEVINFLRSNPQLAKLNAHIEQKPVN